MEAETVFSVAGSNVYPSGKDAQVPPGSMGMASTQGSAYIPGRSDQFHSFVVGGLKLGYFGENPTADQKSDCLIVAMKPGNKNGRSQGGNS